MNEWRKNGSRYRKSCVSSISVCSKHQLVEIVPLYGKKCVTETRTSWRIKKKEDSLFSCSVSILVIFSQTFNTPPPPLVSSTFFSLWPLSTLSRQLPVPQSYRLYVYACCIHLVQTNLCSNFLPLFGLRSFQLFFTSVKLAEESPQNGFTID